jgi:hypothetical protein
MTALRRIDFAAAVRVSASAAMLKGGGVGGG